MKRRIVSVLMALVMALSLLPVQALAEDAAVGEPVTEIEQAEQIGEGKEPGDPEEQIGEGEEPGDPEEQTGEGEEPGNPEEEQEPGEPEEPVREFVQGEAQLTVPTAAMAAGTAGERTVPGDIYEALSVGGSLKLLNDVEYSGSMDVAFDLVIDLNGYVLKMTGIKVEKGVHLTIKDSRSDAEHKFTSNTDGLWVRDEQNGTKTVNGGVIYGGTGSSIGTYVYGGGVYVVGGGRFTMEGGNIVGCTASATFQARGGGVFVAEKGTFTMSGGSIAGCTTVGGLSYGGGIYNEGTMTLSGTAEIRDCHAKDSDGDAAFGGGISDNGEAFQISGNVRITGCTASGGGMDAVSMGTGSVISGGTFDGSVQNTGTISGGTFNGRVVNSNMITNGTFNGEVVNDYGTISGGTFNGRVVNSNMITNGTFNGEVVNDYGTITGGTFYGSIKDPGNKISGVTVTYKDGDNEYAKQVLPSGAPATRPDDLAKHGYTFDGWYTSDGAQWDFTTAVTENITLTARWTLKAQEVSSEQGLTDALADSANGVVRLTADITITAGLKITRDVTVDLNGHILRYDEAADPDSIFRVKAGKLTLTDSAPTATHSDASLPAGGLITGGKGFKYDNGAGQSYTYYGGGVYVETGASFVLAGGTIYACGVQSGAQSAYGGGIYAEGGSVTMTGGTIRNCAVSADYGASGGAIYAKAGSVTMSGGVISGCSAKDGGGILTSGCTVQITGGRIENCKASEHGGGLYISGHADQISVLDAAISGCEAKRGGGLALIGFAELELGENARITGCTATEKDDTEAGAIEYGAAVYTDLNNPLIFNYPGNFLYANGGRVEGTVYVGTNKIGAKNYYLDSVKATNAIDHTDGKPTTVFTGDVSCEGDIRGGIFHGSVTVTDSNGNMGTAWEKFCGNLSGGTFYGPVTTECHVSGGTFYRGLTMNKNAKLSGQPIDTGSELTDKTNIPDPTGTPVTVTYDYGERGGIYAKQIVQAGEKAIEPDVPSRQGYQFTDWYLDDTKYDFDTAVTGNMTLTAKWTACDHSGHTGAKPTCTTSVICTVCKGTIAALGHDWSPWTSNSDNTHTRTCKRDGSHTETLSCADGDKNHICDDCGKIISNHEDGDNDHVCDICRKTISNHVDADNNHICDICGKTISNHVDTDKNHICDDCGKVISNHVDVDNNHICDDCRKVISDHKDTDRNHICDICGKTISNHVDTDKNHICDICKKTVSNHEDGDNNHVCDICKKIISNHADGNHDHICDICSKAISNHTGGTAYCNAAKVCDYCGKSYGDKDPTHHANLVNVPAKAATTSAEGNIEYWHCGGCGKYYKDAAAQDEIEQKDTVIAKRRVYYAPSLYPVRNGTNPASGTEYPGGVYGLIFRAAVSGITGVQVDGRTVGRGSYTVEGSYPVELYLKASYLNRLAKGGHTLTVLTDSGSLTAAFTVGSGKSSPTTFDAGIAVYTAAAVTSLTGLELLRRRRKEEE